MKRKIILFGSFIAIFLMLLLPNVNSIEYNQVENNIKEKNSLSKEPLKKKTIISNKLTNIKILKNTINEIKNNPNIICSSCAEESLLICFYLFISLIFYANLFRWVENNFPDFPFPLLFFIKLDKIYTNAEKFGCSWIEESN